MGTEKKVERVQLWTPPGRFSYPYFAAPDTGRQYSDASYKSDLLIPKAIFKEKAQALQDAVLKVGREAFGKDFSLKGTKYRVPFKDMDKDDSVENPVMQNSIMVRAKSGPRKKDNVIVKPAIQPMFIGPRKGEDGKFKQLSQEEISVIKGGDWGLLQVTVYPYYQKKDGFLGGVTFGLNAVQLWKTDEGFGQGRSKLLETAEEQEEELDDAIDSDGNTEDAAEQAESII